MFGKLKRGLFSPSVVENNFDALCFNIILFDIFFIPLFPWFSVSVSLPILFIWYLKKRKYTLFEREHRPFVAVVILMSISTLLSFFDFEGAAYNTDFITSFKRCMQYITSFWYFFFFLYFFVFYKRKITNVVFWGIIYITLYALLYFLYQDLFVSLKQTVCPFDPQTSRWLDGNLLVYRFNYLWADPNNVAYATTALSLFFFIEEKESILKKYIVLICLLFILFCTMSFGGIGVAAVLVSWVFFLTKSFRNGTAEILVGIIIILIIAGYLIANFEYSKELIDSSIGMRQEAYGGSLGMSDGGGRGADFMNGLSKFNPLFLFVGSGKEGYVTEIGHIYVLYMYGLPVYIYFMYVLFWKRKKQSFIEYLPIVPLFVGFTMNIAIVEQKFLLITLLISAYYSAESYRRKQIKRDIVETGVNNNR